MDSEQDRNKSAVVAMFEECWNKGNLGFAEEVLVGDFLDHPPRRLTAVPDRGRGALIDLVKAFRAGFSDFHVEMVHVAAERDLVYCLVRATGTHDGTFFGTPATGRRIDITGIHEFRVRNGRLAERWGLLNMMGLMQQIGAGPAGPGGAAHD